MAEVGLGKVLAWAIAAILIVMLASSLTMNGAWMGGIGMGWMTGIGAALIALAIFVAYRFGRLEQKADDPGPKKG